jgi:hypothetical protein
MGSPILPRFPQLLSSRCRQVAVGRFCCTIATGVADIPESAAALLPTQKKQRGSSEFGNREVKVSYRDTAIAGER